jgi:uncharacterized protein
VIQGVRENWLNASPETSGHALTPQLATGSKKPSTWSRRVGLPWQSLLAFVQIVTHPRALPVPLGSADAWAFVDDWLDAPAAWVPQPGRGYRDILGRMVCDLDLRGNMVADAALAALAVEHGLAIVSADTDFARFREVAWLNPISA